MISSLEHPIPCNVPVGVIQAASLVAQIAESYKIFFSGNFEKDARNLDDVDDENNWTLKSVYPGMLTNETQKKMRTRDKESFLKSIVKQFAKY